MCSPPGRSGPQTSDVSVGTLCTLLLDVFQRPVAAESSMIRGPISRLASTIGQVLRLLRETQLNASSMHAFAVEVTLSRGWESALCVIDRKE